MEADKFAVRRFIQAVHGAEPKGWLTVWTRRDKVTASFDLTRGSAVDRAVEYCADHAVQDDVYAAIGLQANEPKNGSRGKEDSVICLPALWADLDLAGAAHKATDLPPTEREALQIIEAAGLPPSVVVRSGFGLQV